MSPWPRPAERQGSGRSAHAARYSPARRPGRQAAGRQSSHDSSRRRGRAALRALAPFEAPKPRTGRRTHPSRNAASGVHDPQDAAVAQPVVHERSVPPALNHPRISEDRQLLRDIHLRAAESDGEVADADGSVTQTLHDGQALGVGERAEDPGLRGEGRSHPTLPAGGPPTQIFYFIFSSSPPPRSPAILSPPGFR